MPAATRKSPKASLLRLALPLGAADGETGRVALPTELVIAPWGASRALDGTPVIVNERTAAVLSANQDEIGRAEIALDFEHNTFDGPDVTPDERHKKEPRKVAGYGALSVVPGKGIVYLPLADAWTPEGIEHVTGKHYRDLSPVPILDEETGEVIAMHSVALTRAGQIPTLRAYSANADLAACLKALSSDSANSDDMNANYRAIACAALGLPATATDEEIVAAGEKKPAAKPAETPGATPIAMSAALDARLKAIEEGQVANQRQAIVTAASAAGKVIPLSADAINLLPPATLQVIVDGLTPGAVPMSSNTPGKDQGDKLGTPKALSAEEAEVVKTLGISAEKFREHNPA